MSINTDKDIEAIQDIDCLDRVKFRYELPFGFPLAAKDAFPANQVRYHAFSAFVPGGMDLLTVISPDRFRLDGAINASHLIVSFDAPADQWPRAKMGEIDRMLRALGYGVVRYRRGESHKCASCRIGQLTDCHGHRLLN